jgi:hypothetical protein
MKEIEIERNGTGGARDYKIEWFGKRNMGGKEEAKLRGKTRRREAGRSLYVERGKMETPPLSNPLPSNSIGF